MFYQQHGFDFENMIIKSLTGIDAQKYKKSQQNGHTAVFDVDKGIHSTKNYSIKVSRQSLNVWTSDIIRFYDTTSSTNFNMIVGCWYPSTKGKLYTKILEFHFTPKYHKQLWNNIPREELVTFCDYIKNIPHGKKPQLENQRIWKERRNDIFSKYGKGITSINAKIDSRVQRRVQSGIKLNDLIETGIKYDLYEESYKDLKLPFIQK